MSGKLIECQGPNCSQIKGSANHWFLVSPEAAEYFMCVPYNSKTKLRGYRPVCGMGCVGKLISLWMDSVHRKSFENPATDQQQLFSEVQDLDSSVKS